MKKHEADRRKAGAVERQEARSKLSAQKQIDILKQRRGNSRREFARLRQMLRREPAQLLLEKKG